jgi:hypothetical protein
MRARDEAPCTCTGDDPLPHTGYVHHLTEPSESWPYGHRTICTITTAAGRCPCTEHTPKETP